ncbi:hypothetical protein [Flavobacterium sp.]|uniref:hypothetical protein n=1 Tax=Flavobacterium sp. TaxID=239 RepID=UPI00261E2D45|nr:hypothetical protein [Flavobacterium sp.]
MRPIVDLNNQWHSEETVVYYSRLNTIFLLVFSLILTTAAFYFIFITQYILALIFLVGSIFLLNYIKHFLLEWNTIQLRINSKGILVRDEPLISWSLIENERITSSMVGRNQIYYFKFYNSELHKSYEFKLDKYNYDFFELIKSVEIHRERFNKNNKII